MDRTVQTNDWPTTEITLLARIRDPADELAWTQFIDIYRPVIYRVARRRGLQDADANDLVQEALRSVARAIDRWQPDPRLGSFRSWLFRVCHNAMVSLLKRESRRIRGTGDPQVAEWIDQCPDSDSGVTQHFELEYRRRLFEWSLEQAKGEVCDVTWQAFYRVSVLNHAPQEVASALGIRVGSVYVAKHRVINRLRNIVTALRN